MHDLSKWKIGLAPRRWLIALLVVVMSAPVFTACKKGDNDPLFSLRSRKARLTGEWDVKTAVWSVDDSTWTFNGTNLTVTHLGGSEPPLPMSMEYEFDKDGMYKQETQTTFPEDFEGNGLPAFTLTESIAGIWNFTGGDGDTKTKSKLLLQTTEESSQTTLAGSNIEIITYDGPVAGSVYDIDQLRNDEMVLKYHTTITTALGQSIEQGEITLEKK